MVMRSVYQPATAMKASLIVLMLVAGAAIAGPSSASAQTDATAEGSTEYRQLVQQALDEFQRGNWDEAAGLFAQAHRLSPSARTLRGMGLSAFEGRQYVASLEHLRAALLSTVNPLTVKQRQEIEETVSRAERYVAKLQLTVTPDSAEVFVNDQPVPNNGGERLVILDPGPVEVRAVSPGHQLALRQLRMVSGAHQHLELRLAPAAGSETGKGAATGTSHFPYATFGWLSVGLAGASGVSSVIAWRVREDAAGQWNDEECRLVRPTDPKAATCSGISDQVSTAETVIVVTAIGAGVFIGSAVLFFVLDGTQNDGATAQACTGGPGELGLQCGFKF